jgi:phytoene desaturase
MFDVVRNEKSSRRAWSCFHTNSNIEKIIVENKIAIAIVVNGEILILI